MANLSKDTMQELHLWWFQSPFLVSTQKL